MKRFFLLIAFISLVSFVNAQTTIPTGNVYGTWTLAGSPYLIQGSLMIPNDSTLIIEPGVYVSIQGIYKIYVQGRLLAIGTAVDTITFIASDTTNGWYGIQFDNTPTTNDTSKIMYCKIEYGIASPAAPTTVYSNGGGILFNNYSKVILSNSLISHNASTRAEGGGLYCTNSSPIIENNTFSYNTAAWGGGGISSDGGSSPIINNNIFIYNSTPNSWGGGISAYGNEIISNNIIKYNIATAGGGIVCGGKETISNNIISHNSEDGISCDNDMSTITNNNISNNTGSGIACGGSSSTISNNIITNNSTIDGGGISCSSYETILNNIISNNTASYTGGGISCSSSNSKIINNAIINNTANYGGGICSNDGSPAITNNTIANNNALIKGGALYCENSASPTLNNTILWGDTASTSGTEVYLYDEASNPNFYYCDVQGGTSSFGITTGNFYTGTYQNNIDTIPSFISPTTGSGTGYNGLTANWSLQTGSPCINAGNPNTTGLNLPALDLAGNPRIIGSIIDIGAYEYQGPVGISTVRSNYFPVIFPNPTVDNLTIESLQSAVIEITNIQGQLVKTITATGNKTNIDVSALPCGVYIVQAKMEKGVAVSKFIKE